MPRAAGARSLISRAGAAASRCAAPTNWIAEPEMAFVALGVLGLIALMLLAKPFVTANPAALAKGVRWAGIGIAALVIGTLAMRGQFEFAGFVVPVVYALARGWLPRWLAGGGGGGGRRAAGPIPGQASS